MTSAYTCQFLLLAPIHFYNSALKVKRRYTYSGAIVVDRGNEGQSQHILLPKLPKVQFQTRTLRYATVCSEMQTHAR
jgi:hypothetical protein